MKTDIEMGRADVLFNFLQLIGKDRPSDIDEFLQNVNLDSDGRAVADQIVDLIIAGDKTLYESYAIARESAGPRSPYSTNSSSRGTSSEYSAALGYFMSQWINFEQRVRAKADENHSPNGKVLLSPKNTLNYIHEKNYSDFKFLRKLRNEVVHGIEKATPEQLNEAGVLLEAILEDMP